MFIGFLYVYTYLVSNIIYFLLQNRSVLILTLNADKYSQNSY